MTHNHPLDFPKTQSNKGVRPLYPEEDFDTKMLLYPFEKQLDLPPASIEIGDGDRRQREVVGQEHQPFAGLGVFELDAAQWRVEVLARVETGERDSLIANQAGASIMA